MTTGEIGFNLRLESGDKVSFSDTILKATFGASVLV